MSSDTPPQSGRGKSRSIAASIIVWFVGSVLVVAAMLLWIFYRDAVEQVFNWVPGWIFLLTLVLLVGLGRMIITDRMHNMRLLCTMFLFTS